MTESSSMTAFLDEAKTLDQQDPLAGLRSEFLIPKDSNGADQIYFVSNSLGLPSTTSKRYLDEEFERWAGLGVTGHFVGGYAWKDYHDLVAEQMASVVGCLTEEVVVMNSLTVNLHLLLISFYQPTPDRHKILIEDHAFPSDHFAVESQIRQRGLDPATSLVTVSPRPGAETLEPQDILDAIAEHGDQLAVVMLPGVQYYTGQVLPMADIVRAGHAAGAKVGLDLAHAVGNVPLDLHDWGADFAVWCTYKYMGAGPGSVGGAFVHNRHIADQSLDKLTGWWGTNKSTRFEMETRFDPIRTAESWQPSNSPILLMATLRASLDVIERAGGVSGLRAKAEIQIGYLDRLLHEVIGSRVELINPHPLEMRGCQFSLRVTDPDRDGQAVFKGLEDAGVACDWRYPNVIRVAPAPLYNTFEEIYRFVQILDGLV